MMTPQRADRMKDTLRRFVRRGARANISKLLAKTRPEDVAVSLRGLMPAEHAVVFDILFADYPDAVGEVLTEVDPAIRLSILRDLSAQQIASLIEGMPVDDAVALVESLPKELHDQVLELVDLKDALDEVQAQLTYEEDTAGRIMSPDFFALPAASQVSEAIAAVQDSEDLDNIFYLYVVNEDGHLVGVTSLRQLFLSRPEKRLTDVMTQSLIKVETDTDQEEVAQLASRYDLLAIPVTDETNRLVGIVTLDDIIDVVKDEANEDFYKMVGTSDDELVYEERSFKVAGIRLPWLLVNLAGLLVTGLLLKHFEALIAARLTEALLFLFFVPVIMGMGGNIGSQTSTIAVRGLATGRIGHGKGPVRRFVLQQVKVGLVIAVSCALVAGGVAYWLQRDPMYSLIVSSSLFLAVMVASMTGAVIPLLSDRIGVDPAVAAGPLVTTLNDITGIVIYYGLALLVLGWTAPLAG